MIPFVRIAYRGTQAVEPKRALPNWIVALVLLVILCLQIALLLLIA